MFERLPALQVRASPVLLSLKDDGGNGDPRKQKSLSTRIKRCRYSVHVYIICTHAAADLGSVNGMRHAGLQGTATKYSWQTADL